MTRSVKEATEQELADGFRKCLDRHGYGLQCALAEAIQQAARTDRTSWLVESLEVPVEVGDRPTRVDFVLKSVRRPVWLVCEAKRVDPALGYWAFAAAPVVGGYGPTEIVGEVVMRSSTERFAARGATVGTCADVFDFGLELRTHQHGDGSSRGRDAIEDTLTQVIRGANGFIDLLAVSPSLMLVHEPTAVVPVVFTTARLWSTTDDLASASLVDGRVTAPPQRLHEHQWLAVRHRTTPALQHGNVHKSTSESLSAVVHEQFLRAVFIVRANCVLEFLAWAQSGIAASWPN